jgi:hypothetical protein
MTNLMIRIVTLATCSIALIAAFSVTPVLRRPRTASPGSVPNGGAVAQWRKMAQEGRPIRRNRCETGISRGDDT